MTRFGDFLILRATFQSSGQQLFCPNHQHILGNFCEGVKIFHFTKEILFGQLFTGHTDPYVSSALVVVWVVGIQFAMQCNQ